MSGMSVKARNGRPGRGSFDFALCRELSAIRARGDLQRKAVYAWQREVLGDLCREPWLGADEHGAVTKKAARKAAVAYLERIWTRYSPRVAACFAGAPWLRLGFHDYGGGAHACKVRHAIYCHLDQLRRCTLVHEVGHLLTWQDPGHGPDFCAAMIHMWDGEFGIRPGQALVSAVTLGVEVTVSGAGEPSAPGRLP